MKSINPKGHISPNQETKESYETSPAPFWYTMVIHDLSMCIYLPWAILNNWTAAFHLYACLLWQKLLSCGHGK